MSVPPSGRIALLFTDIEGSTRLLHRLKDVYADVLAEHRRLLRAAWSTHDGYEASAEGDAFFVAFASPAAAVRAAEAGQRALAAHRWPDGVVVRVRMGLHLGTPRLVDGTYVGLDVHHAARVGDSAHGGQVVLSESLREALGTGTPVADLGLHRLKDILEPERLYQLRVEGLPDGFPPLRTAGLTNEDVRDLAPEERRKFVTLVSARFPRLEGLDPERLRALHRGAADKADSVCRRFGGELLKGTPGATVIAFGVPVVHEDDAIRAAEAALELRSELGTYATEIERQWGVRPAPEIRVVSGDAFVSTDASGRFEIVGEIMDAAFDLSGGAGDVVVDAATERLAGGRLQTSDKDGRTTLEAVAAGARVPFDGVPFVGREAEIEELMGALAKAERDERPYLCTLFGVAGIGKSRLVAEIKSRIGTSARFLSGRCPPYGESVTFQPLREIIEDAFEGRDHGAALSRLVGVPDAAVLSANVGQAGTEAPAVEIPAEQLLLSVMRFVSTLALDRPVVLYFDDIHWAEPLLLDLLEQLAGSATTGPVLILCSARPDLLDARPHWGGGALRSTTMFLQPLDLPQTLQLVDSLLDGRPHQRETIAAAAEGNPLFVEQMVAMIGEDPQAALTVPPSIEALLAARLDRLSGRERAAIEAASIVGRDFSPEAVSALLRHDVLAGLAGRLEALARRELVQAVRPAGEQRMFEFRHALIREAAYRAIPMLRRAEMHEQLGEWLEGAGGSTTEVVAHHFEQAFLNRRHVEPTSQKTQLIALRAAVPLRDLGRRASATGDMKGAVALLGRAAVVAPNDALRLEVASMLVDPLQAIGDFVAARDRIAEMRALAIDLGDENAEAHSHIDEWLMRSSTDSEISLNDFEEAASHTLNIFERTGDEVGQAKAHRALGEVHLTACNWGESAAALERALVHAELGEDEKEVVLSLTLLANALYWGPTPAGLAVTKITEVLERARHHPTVEATVLCFLAGLNSMLGDVGSAAGSLERARQIFEELGHRTGVAAHTLLAGEVWLISGDPERAAASLRPGYEMLTEMGAVGILSSVVAFLADAELQRGNLDEASTLADLCEELAPDDDVASQILCKTVRAQLETRLSRLDDALSLAMSAVLLAETTDFLNAQGRAGITLARVHAARGEFDQAKVVAQSAVRAFTAKGNLAEAERAMVQLP